MCPQQKSTYSQTDRQTDRQTYRQTYSLFTYSVCDEKVKIYIQDINWEVSSHPPYLSDIVPSDYHLFRAIRNKLSSQHFKSLLKITKNESTNRSSQQARIYTGVKPICGMKDGQNRSFWRTILWINYNVPWTINKHFVFIGKQRELSLTLITLIKHWLSHKERFVENGKISQHYF